MEVNSEGWREDRGRQGEEKIESAKVGFSHYSHGSGSAALLTCG